MWFTDFARPRTQDPDKELQFMQDILPLLEESEAVAAYAWFVTRKPEPGGGEVIIRTVCKLYHRSAGLVAGRPGHLPAGAEQLYPHQARQILRPVLMKQSHKTQKFGKKT